MGRSQQQSKPVIGSENFEFVQSLLTKSDLDEQKAKSLQWICVAVLFLAILGLVIWIAPLHLSMSDGSSYTDSERDFHKAVGKMIALIIGALAVYVSSLERFYRRRAGELITKANDLMMMMNESRPTSSVGVENDEQ